MSSAQNPYAPEPRQHEDKDWLYQRYWGELESLEEIAAKCDVSRETVQRAMVDLGIPRRHPKARIWGMPLAGFRERGDGDGE